MANIITACRILCSILLLFVPAFSPALFILPLTLHIVDLKYSGCYTCMIAFLAAVQEGYLIITENTHEMF